MAQKKPTPAQVAARKKFAENAKNGTFAKKRKTAPKAKYKVSYEMLQHTGKWKKDRTVVTYTTKTAAQKYADQLNRGPSYRNAKVVLSTSKLNGPKPKGITKFTAANAHVEGVKRNGTLKKGYKYEKGGKVVKVKAKPVTRRSPAKKTAAKRKPAAKK